MLDIKRIKNQTQSIKKKCSDRGINCDNIIDEIILLDNKRIQLLQDIEQLRYEQNKISKSIPMLKKEGQDTSNLLQNVSTIKEKIVQLNIKIKEVMDKLQPAMYSLPNIPDDDLTPGGKENNKVLRYSEINKTLDFDFKNHIDLCTGLNLIDYARGVKLGGSGFWIYTGMGARLEWALINFFIDTHIKDGYEMILPPLMLEYQCGLTAGQFPKFVDEVYKISNPTDENRLHYMIPTSEAALVSIYRDEILAESEIPKKFFAFTPCFRREAGSYRSEERGMIRGHQFNKVEMFQYTLAEQSDMAFDELVEKAEKLVAELGLHYRVVKLAMGDCSASMARTYDIEIFIPSMNGYKEVSSVSNARDYQSRRGNIRVRRKNNIIEYLHTLNGSGLATSRILPALVEQNQQKDGTIVIPEVLRKYIGNLEVIS